MKLIIMIVYSLQSFWLIGFFFPEQSNFILNPKGTDKSLADINKNNWPVNLLFSFTFCLVMVQHFILLLLLSLLVLPLVDIINKLRQTVSIDNNINDYQQSQGNLIEPSSIFNIITYQGKSILINSVSPFFYILFSSFSL